MQFDLAETASVYQHKVPKHLSLQIGPQIVNHCVLGCFFLPKKILENNLWKLIDPNNHENAFKLPSVTTLTLKPAFSEKCMIADPPRSEKWIS